MVEYMKSNHKHFKTPCTVNDDSKVWTFSFCEIKEDAVCNHHEADTRMIYYAIESDQPVVIVSDDTDVLILMIYAHSKSRSSETWLMKIAQGKFVDVGIIQDHYGAELCGVLPNYHAITGSDFTSFPYGVGKIKPFRKMIKTRQASLLLTNLGEKITDEVINKCLGFIQTVMYPGIQGQSYVDTRIKMYEKQKERVA